MQKPTSNIHSGWNVDYWCDRRYGDTYYYGPLDSVSDLFVPHARFYVQQIRDNTNLSITSVEMF